VKRLLTENRVEENQLSDSYWLSSIIFQLLTCDDALKQTHAVKFSRELNRLCLVAGLRRYFSRSCHCFQVRCRHVTMLWALWLRRHLCVR